MRNWMNTLEFLPITQYPDALYHLIYLAILHLHISLCMYMKHKTKAFSIVDLIITII